MKNESNKGSKSMQSIIVGIDESYHIHQVTKFPVSFEIFDLST